MTAGQPGRPEPPRPTVRPTRPGQLAVAVVLGFAAGWLLVRLADAVDRTPPLVPWIAPLTLLLAAGFVGYLAWLTHQQLQVQRVRMEPHRAVAMLLLGKSAALVGAIVAGGYLGFAVNFLGRLDVPDPRQRVLRSAVAVLAGAGLAVGGLLLERACRVRRDDGDDDEDDRGGDDADRARDQRRP